MAAVWRKLAKEDDKRTTSKQVTRFATYEGYSSIHVDERENGGGGSWHKRAEDGQRFRIIPKNTEFE